MQRPDDHQMSATARRSPSPSPSNHLSAIRGTHVGHQCQEGMEICPGDLHGVAGLA